MGFVLREIIKAIALLHELGIIHGDINVRKERKERKGRGERKREGGMRSWE